MKIFLTVTLFVLLMITLSRPVTSHGKYAWIGDYGYTNPVTQEYCCGETDCFEINVERIKRVGDEYRFQMFGEKFTYPANQTLDSRDGKTWVCFNLHTRKPRCLFVAPRGS